MKFKLYLSNYGTKTDLKNATRIDIPAFAKKIGLASLNSNVGKLDIDKLKKFPTNLSSLKSKVDNLDVDKLLPAPVDLSKLSDVAKMMSLNIYIYIYIYIYNAKIENIKGKIPNIINLATGTALNAVENKIPSPSHLVKKTDYNTKINEIEKKTIDHNHDKYITTPEFNKFTAEIFDLRLK